MDAPSSFERVKKALGDSTAAMAKFFGVTDAALSQWKKDGFPPHRAIEVERRLKGKIKAAEIAVTQRKKRAA
jgi:DNA-binding transcriptional regulator YdaS (Cro superfamily)